MKHRHFCIRVGAGMEITSHTGRYGTRFTTLILYEENKIKK